MPHKASKEKAQNMTSNNLLENVTKLILSSPTSTTPMTFSECL